MRARQIKGSNKQKGDKRIYLIYQQLYREIGPRHWWPAESPFEVIIGAILTQNTSWRNVEKAIKALKEEKLLDPMQLHQVQEKYLASVIRPSGFFNIKARRIKSFINFLFADYQGSIKKMFAEDWPRLREKLLSIDGIGPETADSILLYAGEKPVFVVDAYTKRILNRHGIIPGDASYDDIQEVFMKALKKDVGMFNEFHALLVHVGKKFCKKKPLCVHCPMLGM